MCSVFKHELYILLVIHVVHISIRIEKLLMHIFSALTHVIKCTKNTFVSYLNNHMPYNHSAKSQYLKIVLCIFIK